jgi:hypothetical protein
MKLFFSILALCCFNASFAQPQNYQEIVKRIQSKIKCCAVPIAASSSKKVANISINIDGSTTFSYSDKSPDYNFNLFQLYKEEQSKTGIDTILKGRVIQFSETEQRARLIKFATADDAAEVYEAFLQLINIGKAENKMFSDLNFKQTIDVINTRLSKWTEKPNLVRLTAEENGNILLTNGKHRFNFNLFELISSSSERNEGIEIRPCDPLEHAPSSWMYFNSYAKSLAFIRFTCLTPEAELDIIKGAFIHLKSLCKKVTYYNKSSDG